MLLRFLARFLAPRADLATERETLVVVEGELRPATLYLPSTPATASRHRARGRASASAGSAPAPPGRRAPAWVLLQGVTVPGRHHEGVRRMARSLAAAGHFVLVPEVPSWTALQVDPRHAAPVLRGALAAFGSPAIDLPVDRERIGLMGFSVAGTWALQVAAGELGRRLRSVVSLGGYGDFHTMTIAMLTGEHEWRGRRHRYTPDPYGRWILAADLLPRLDDRRYGSQPEREAVARALHQLAHTAGRNGAAAGTAVYDPLIAHLRETVPPGARTAWDLLAPPSTHLVPDPPAGRALAAALATAGLQAHPDLDPTERLRRLAGGPAVILLHGRQDTLIPFTETLRLAAALPPSVRPTVAITRLIGHAKAALSDLLTQPARLVYEAWRFAATMARLAGSLED